MGVSLGLRIADHQEAFLHELCHHVTLNLGSKEPLSEHVTSMAIAKLSFVSGEQQANEIETLSLELSLMQDWGVVRDAEGWLDEVIAQQPILRGMKPSSLTKRRRDTLYARVREWIIAHPPL